MTAQPAEAATGLLEPGGDPADEHAAVASAAHVVHEVPDEAVEVLDRVRTPHRPVQRASDTEALEREGLPQPFAQRAGRAGADDCSRRGGSSIWLSLSLRLRSATTRFRRAAIPVR